MAAGRDHRQVAVRLHDELRALVAAGVARPDRGVAWREQDETEMDWPDGSVTPGSRRSLLVAALAAAARAGTPLRTGPRSASRTAAPAAARRLGLGPSGRLGLDSVS